MLQKIKIGFLVLVLGFTSCKQKQTKSVEQMQEKPQALTYEQMSASKDIAKEAFNDAKYGMFIHWGLYAIPGGIWKGKKMEELKGPRVAEWIQFGAEIPRAEYAELATQFNPTHFDADAIAKLAKEAGMKYLVITSKHHDGFAMYDSKVSEYDIIDATPYSKDIVKELYDACQKYGVDFGLYYSHNIDWNDGNDCGLSEYLASGGEVHDRVKRKAGVNTWDPSPNTFTEYLENKAYPQVKEILTKFPNMTTLWYDYPHYVTPEESLEFYKIAYDLQPNMLVNSRVGNDLGDFDIPGDNKIPSDHLAITKPWQTVGTTNNSWGYKSYDHDWKSVKELLFWLTEIVSKGGNYMLNIGPDALGDVPQESVTNLLEVGKFLDVNGEAIYNTRKWKVTHEGPTKIEMNGTHDRANKADLKFDFTPSDFWFTQKEHTIYAISLAQPKEAVLIKSITEKEAGVVKSVSLVGSEAEVEWTQTEVGLQVNLGTAQENPNGYALKIEI
ncbi:alpha-L-fucosidase [Formosa algae]|uniref:alpha-L-fucosidase n=1 Tax=Formosa algae TaxID=225843 RepID=A0A9X1CCF3_9FLAO|nr:alpha-L-fucosidase [Formosa algae]MBP1840094.1 alpha-L-fucosidase [Formosa algae]MDQ0335694.1 alpha-L-fucosidase [Formosa algae]